MSEPVANKPISISVGDYLKAIWSVAGEEEASTKNISERLAVAPASVSSMLLRLQKMGFANYEPYHGASLTERGRKEALRLLRRHRLIEAFLMEQLDYSLNALHAEAESLEHAVSDEFTEKLADLLGHPDRDPHGDRIPASDGTLQPEQERPLSEEEPGSRVCICRVDHRDSDALTYLGEKGLLPGTLLRVVEARALDGVVTIEDAEGTCHTLGHPLASSIFVS